MLHLKVSRYATGKQILDTTGGFVLCTPYMPCNYLTHYVIKLNMLDVLKVPQFVTLHQEYMI